MKSNYKNNKTTRELIKENMAQCPACKGFFSRQGIKNHFKRMHPEQEKQLTKEFMRLYTQNIKKKSVADMSAQEYLLNKKSWSTEEETYIITARQAGIYAKKKVQEHER